MDKLNLLDIPDDQNAPPYSGPDKEDDTFDSIVSDDTIDSFGKTPESEAVDEFDSFEGTPLFPMANDAGEAKEDKTRTAQTDGTTKPPKGAQTVSKDDYQPPSAFDEKDGSKTTLYRILGVIGALLLIAIGYFALAPLFRGGDNPTQPVVEQPAQPETDQPQAPASNLPAALASQYRQNQGENDFRTGMADRLLNAAIANNEHNLVVIADGYVYTSVLANTRGDIDRYRSELQRLTGGTAPKLESTENTTAGGRSKIIANFSTRVTGGGGGAAVTTSDIISEQNFDAGVRSLAKQSNVNVRYLNKGTQVRENGLNATNYYIRVNGNQQAVSGFIRNFVAQYPSVKLEKLSLFTPNANVISKGNLSANLELKFYSPAR